MAVKITKTISRGVNVILQLNRIGIFGFGSYFRIVDVKLEVEAILDVDFNFYKYNQ